MTPKSLHFKEQRRFPRIHLSHSVALTCHDDDAIEMTVLELSGGGLKLQCNQRKKEQLFLSARCMKSYGPVEIAVRMELPRRAGGSDLMAAICRVIYSRRVAINCFHVGMQFTAFDDETAMKLGAFIDEQLRGSHQ